jgi:protein subunit release factor A
LTRPHRRRALQSDPARYSKEEPIMKSTIEIRAGEGGDDAKLFAVELAQTYLRLADKLD